MADKIACKFCVIYKGITLKDCFSTEEELADHIEKEHHIPVQREGETGAEAEERHRQENPEAGGPNCKCPACSAKRRVR